MEVATEQLASPESDPVERPIPVSTSVDDIANDETPDTPAPEVDDSEEIEHDGSKYKIPKVLKDAFLRQSDYTVKTQTLAQQRQAFEAAQQQFAARQQFQQAHIQGVAKVMAIDERLAQFRQLDWNALTDADPVQAMKLDRQVRELQTQRAQQVQAIETAQARSTMDAQQATARGMQEARTQLAKDIKGFGTPEVTKSLTEVGKAFGYKPEELANVSDPRAVRLLHEAYLYRQLVAKAKTPEPVTNVTPITRVSGSGAVSTKSMSDPNLSDAEFAALRKKQIARRN